MTDAATQTRDFDPRVMMGVIPYIGMNGLAGEAVDFYARAFGAKEIGRFMDEASGKLIHVQIEVNGGALMMSDMNDPEAAEPARPAGFHLQLVVREGDAWWTRAVDAGCEVVAPFQKMFWGDRWGMVRDPFGLQWAVNEVSESEARA